MIDGARLRTPARDGEILVLPEVSTFLAVVEENRRCLSAARGTILHRSITEWRREIREQFVGSDDRPLVVTGHQPSFPHPGVWAKQIVARRFAQACGGTALNLIIDSDGIEGSTLAVPGVHAGAVQLRHVPLPAPHDVAVFEQMRGWSADDLRTFEDDVHHAAGDSFRRSLMPQVIAALRSSDPAFDGVDQRSSALSSLDRTFSVDVRNLRISRAPVFPLLADMTVNAERFASAYNRALAWYRTTFRVRGAQRPIPDLLMDAHRCEIAAWAYRATGPRRRVFVKRRSDRIGFFAGDAEIGTLSLTELMNEPGAMAMLDGWRIRPRALATTTWARLLLADLFIHGIGGAKYDRVTDRILADYYGVERNEIACASATLWLDLPRTNVTEQEVRRRRRADRDWIYNPQRCAEHPPHSVPMFLLQRREAAVQYDVAMREQSPHERSARRAAFIEIRSASAAIRDAATSTEASVRRKLADAEASLLRDRIGKGREYFIGLYDAPTLQRLLQALPSEQDFRR